MNYQLKCMSCNYTFTEDDFYNICPKCGGVLETIIDNIENAQPDYNYDTILRYHQFLPISDYKSLEKYESAKPTPIIEAKALAQKYNIKELLIKDESMMVSGTMKDREALLTVNRLVINNVKGLVLGSSGNAGISIAWYASKIKGPKVHFFLPECSRERMEDLIDELTDKDIVKVYYIAGSTDEAEDAGKKFAKENNLPYGTGFNNYARREGVKTFALEYIYEQEKRADWYFQGVAGALAIYAFHKVHKELGIKCPKVGGVQPDACAPMVDAYKDGAEILHEKYIPKNPIVVPEAPVLKSRKPIGAYPIIKRIFDETNGYFEKVSAEEIWSALDDFYLEDYFIEKFNVTGRKAGVEPATALAGIIKMRKNNIIKENETVLLNFSGAARPTDIPDDIWNRIYQRHL